MKLAMLGLIVLNLVFLFLNLTTVATATSTLSLGLGIIGTVSASVGLYFSVQGYKQQTNQA